MLLLKRIISVNSICSLQQIATSTRYSAYIQQMLKHFRSTIGIHVSHLYEHHHHIIYLGKVYILSNIKSVSTPIIKGAGLSLTPSYVNCRPPVQQPSLGIGTTNKGFWNSNDG